jgi:DNA-binding FadR family transcriptional regulator
VNESAENEVTHRFLQHLADHSDNELLREMSDQILRGNITMADGMSSSAYSEALALELGDFTRWYDSLSNDERQRVAADCEAVLTIVDEQLQSDHER